MLMGWGCSTLLYPSLCWNDAETDDQHKEPMIDTKIIKMCNQLGGDGEMEGGVRPVTTAFGVLAPSPLYRQNGGNTN